VITSPPPWSSTYQDTTGCLCANSHPGSYTGQDAYNDMLITQKERNIMSEENTRYVVRRLTPLECCRLQGFPDDWCEGVPGSDSAQYKMWGNGMALPNALHVVKGIRNLVLDEMLS